MPFEEGLWRVYERSLYLMVGTPGTIPEDDIHGRATRSRKLRQLEKYCQGILTLSAISFFCVFIFLIFAHFTFIGVNSGACLVPKVNYSFPKDVILRLRFGESSTTDSPYFVAEYEFSRSISFAALDNAMRKKHVVKTRNITLGDECISTSLSLWASIVGHDTVIINQLLFGLHRGGVLHNLNTNEYWTWSDEQIIKHTQRGVLDTMWNLISVPVNATVSYMLITCVTALLIRILLSSGVIVIYPLLFLLGRCSSNASLANPTMIANVFRIAYPWLGRPIMQLQTHHRSVWPLVFAHIFKVCVYWSIYEACQIMWNYWFFAKSVPSGMTDWAYGMFMFVEYYSMLFMRSDMTLRHFPRLLFVSYVLYYAYFESTLYGLFYPTVLLFAISVFYMCCWFVYKCEIPAYMQCKITEEVTRAHMNRMASPAWVGGIPSEVSLFHPVTEFAQPRLFSRRGGRGGGDEGDDLPLSRQQPLEPERKESETEDYSAADHNAAHGLSSLMQMAGVSFNYSDYVQVSDGGRDVGETKRAHAVIIDEYTSEEDESSSDDDAVLLSRP